LSQELKDAEEYVRSLLPPPFVGPVTTDWRFIPSSELGGDAFGYHWLDEDHFSIYLLDVSGHGVSAALLSVSVVNTLRSKSLPAVDFKDPPQVLSALNGIYGMEAQDNKYFSIWYGVYDRKQRNLRYSSAGHPPAVLIHGASLERNKMIELGKGGPPIGMLTGVSYEGADVRVGLFNRLYVFSDGAYEVTRPDGEMSSFQEWLDYLSKESLSKDFNIDQILRDLKKERGSDSFQDDVSIVEASFA
jgi:sigma-B regulation protein RsbU (phosphoserine phosphatase)